MNFIVQCSDPLIDKYLLQKWMSGTNLYSKHLLNKNYHMEYNDRNRKYKVCHIKDIF